jgi:hypothetical protein
MYIPPGWSTFGTHVDDPRPLLFSLETDETGLPKWERLRCSSSLTQDEHVFYCGRHRGHGSHQRHRDMEHDVKWTDSEED